ncbi:hypothetical protein DFQ14_101225 [Halopolyspora algeriensis]|uniref:Uncharacterized protein n=1 Tax=Halopolyspora algeriensis TaxID=1500506 RepID=A0A368VY77_9ACTN|nr:hypothetical protein [Halopolyspora algeriensis]RCW46885.1 hypothetical protein DFQ14_101225 [Halopolyspora algeriensis]TQM47976.1 hypothetical protein FHU43_2928 [Halopolyspora algeriensis]
MIYILAAIGTITLIVLMWQAFGPVRDAVNDRTDRSQPVAPDDDPDFLRRLDEQRRKQRDDES